MGKSKAQMMRVAAVLHVLFSLDNDHNLTPELSASAVKAAINLVDVCNEHTRIFAGRSDSSSGTTSDSCKLWLSVMNTSVNNVSLLQHKAYSIVEEVLLILASTASRFQEGF